uniref:Leucine-rich repeat and WD repeat-containing protein 1 n=1 Tax=Hippocampus comes TaxID=109280 RepID=A0A3Q2YJ18_HIPCM
MLGLKSPDLPVQLLSRLQSLERWDLSGNRLHKFPKNLELPKLRFLDLSDNQMEDVTSMASLCYQFVSDNYKLMTLLPKLRSYNGKDITSTANHVRFVFTENLRTRVRKPGKMADLEEDFVNTARKEVKYGPSSVSSFTKWKVMKWDEVLTPTKRKQTLPMTNDDLRLTPRKKSRCDPSAPSSPVRLQPLHVLQCHSKQDNSDDFSTQLWACAFQPQLGGHLVATCGGDSLCVIDCETGMVMKKYKVTGEEFFSLAWSTVLMSRGGGASAQPCSILAAGGKRGLVKLIHPRCNVAYGEFRASRRALSVLRFNHRQGNFLFTGCYDNKIVLWDIVFFVLIFIASRQLLVLESSCTPLHICLPPSKPDVHLLAGCEDGLHCYNTKLAPNKAEITFPVYEKEEKDLDYHTVDGLCFLTDAIVASKNFMHDCIYLWSWSRTRSQRPNKSGCVRAVVLAELRWARTEIPYLALNTCPGKLLQLKSISKTAFYINSCLDFNRIKCPHRGRVNASARSAQVLQWPAVVRKGLAQVEGPSINSVAMDPGLQYLVALSDKNMVMVWKRAP